MKAISVLSALFLANAALAAEPTTVQCYSETNYNLRLDLSLHAEYGSVLGASVYDVSKGQTGSSTYSETSATGRPDPMAPFFDVVLKSGKVLVIDDGAIESPSLGTVNVDGETYYCREIF